MKQAKTDSKHHVVIIGGGFGGLYATKSLGHKLLKVTLIDKRNFHLFQPLLYQIATGGLSAGDIASPLRVVLNNRQNVTVLKAEAIDIKPQQRQVILQDGALSYDALIISTGVSHHYFGHADWEERAPGLKTVEDALEIRARIFMAFEAAEREPDPARRRALMTFVVVGGGPTGVELAGALAELAHVTLKNDFRHIDPTEANIILLEGVNRVLPPYPPDLSAKAEKALAALGVTVCTGALVTDIKDNTVTIRDGEKVEQIAVATVLWAAGIKASSLSQVLAKRTGVELDQVGRVIVEADLSLAGHPNIFVIGDLAHCASQDNKPLPGVAPVAIQQGFYVANLIQKRLQGKNLPAFSYRNKGSMAVIGRHAAVVDLGFMRYNGFFAWLTWLFVHIMYLVEFDNKILVLIQWTWNYFTRNRGSRLITGRDSFTVGGV